jgi:hypothetical protein
MTSISSQTLKKEVEFRIRMLSKGVHMMHGGGACPSLTRIKTSKIIEAAGEVEEMAES